MTINGEQVSQTAITRARRSPCECEGRSRRRRVHPLLSGCDGDGEQPTDDLGSPPRCGQALAGHAGIVVTAIPMGGHEQTGRVGRDFGHARKNLYPGSGLIREERDIFPGRTDATHPVERYQVTLGKLRHTNLVVAGQG